jgi:glycosyltransferase involved in cell wall biosynthesis
MADAEARNIILVTSDFPPIQGPGVWRTLGFARHLPALGWKVSVVCSDRNAWHDRTEPGLLDILPPGIDVHRVRGRPAGAIVRKVFPASVATFWRELFPDPAFLPALKMASQVLIRTRGERRPVVLVTSGPPHACHLAGLLLKRLRPCLWIADFRDLWMDDPVQAWSGAYQGRLGRIAEKAVLSRADAIVTVSPSWVAHLAKEGTSPVVLIRNAADIDDHEVPPPRRIGSPGERVLLFAGTPQLNNTGDELWQGIQQYLNSRDHSASPIRFAFLGLDSWTQERIALMGLTEHIHDLGAQTHRETVALLRGADASLIPIRVTGEPASKGTIPAKVYQAVTLRRPIVLLAEPDGDAAALLTGYPHLFARGDDPEAIALALRKFAAGALPAEAPAAPPALEGWSRAATAVALDSLIAKLRADRRGAALA